MSIPCKAHSLLFIDNKNYIIAGSYNSILIWHISSNNYHMVNTIWTAHNSDIDCLILLTNDYFASGSRDCELNFGILMIANVLIP
jgi:WD40 repeat protein